MDTKTAFGKALKDLRIKKGISQEDFGIVSSRTYVSSLERGIYTPTLEKVESLSTVLGIHPLSLLIETWRQKEGCEIDLLIEKVKTDLKQN